jgi:uncharacterized protein (TIGR00297 family)
MVAMLDRPGLVLTLVFGAAIAFFGSFLHLILVFLFLLLSIMVTRFGYYEKKEMGIYEHDRSWENVLSNGLIPTLVVMLSFFLGLGPIPFICSVSAVTADKFASELGVLGGQPISLDGLKGVKPGTSGAVSITGTFMSLAGAALVGVAAIFLFGVSPTMATLVTVAGFAGALVDTLFGVFEEKGFGTKGTTNIICSITGAAIGMVIA